MPPTLFINDQLEISQSELEISASRSGGPGGQHVNKTSSKVTLRWSIAQSQSLSEETRNLLLKLLASKLTLENELVIQVDTSRSQIQNRELAFERLAHIVQKALTLQKKRVPTKPKKSAQLRRLQKKKHIGDLKRQRKSSVEESD